jgi:hypothetical protein
VLQVVQRSFFAACLMFALIGGAATSAHAADAGGNFGLGFQLGDPAAITIKDNLSETRAFDAGIAFNLAEWTLIYGDYLFKMPGLFGNKNSFVQQTTPYIGIGPMLVISNESVGDTRNQRYFSSSNSAKVALAARVPVGAEWRAPTMPLGVYLELDPGIVILPATFSFIQIGFGARFYF